MRSRTSGAEILFCEPLLSGDIQPQRRNVEIGFPRLSCNEGRPFIIKSVISKRGYFLARVVREVRYHAGSGMETWIWSQTRCENYKSSRIEFVQSWSTTNVIGKAMITLSGVFF
jgi:hypothetical protein